MKRIVSFIRRTDGLGVRRDGERAGADRQHSRESDSTNRTPACRARRSRFPAPVLPGGSMNGVTDAGGVYRFPSLPPGTYHVKVELSRIQDAGARTHRRARRADHAARILDEGRCRVGNRDGHRHVADGRHDERERRREPEQRTAPGNAGRTRSLGPARRQGAGPQHEPAGRGRNVGRPAGRLQRPRHDRVAEHPVPQRRQRRRSGGDRRSPASTTTSTRSTTCRSRPARTTSPCRPAACSSTW